jgi:hypothetical protein
LTRSPPAACNDAGYQVTTSRNLHYREASWTWNDVLALVTNDAQLTIAREAVARLMHATIKNARDRGFHVLSEFFLNEALFQLPRLFPLTD